MIRRHISLEIELLLLVEIQCYSPSHLLQFSKVLSHFRDIGLWLLLLDRLFPFLSKPFLPFPSSGVTFPEKPSVWS